MKNMLSGALLMAATLAWAGPSLAAGWDVDAAHGQVGFGVRHMMVANTRGNFKTFSGAVVTDEKDITKSTVTMDIDVASISTANDKRDEHLRSPEFFDTAKFPKMTFKSTKVEKAGNQLKVTGNLTIRDVTKPVTLTVDGPAPEVKDPWGNQRSSVHAVGKLNRQDFGLKWNKTLEAGGVVVGDEVTLDIEVELIKKK